MSITPVLIPQQSPAVVPKKIAVANEASDEESEEEKKPVTLVSDTERPCGHNHWTKHTKKRGKLVLRCVVCEAVWKTRPEAHEKCPAFHAGRCDLDDECPHPHVYARRETASLARRKARLAKQDAKREQERREQELLKKHEDHSDEEGRASACSTPSAQFSASSASVEHLQYDCFDDGSFCTPPACTSEDLYPVCNGFGNDCFEGYHYTHFTPPQSYKWVSPSEWVHDPYML